MVSGLLLNPLIVGVFSFYYFIEFLEKVAPDLFYARMQPCNTKHLKYHTLTKSDKTQTHTIKYPRSRLPFPFNNSGVKH